MSIQKLPQKTLDSQGPGDVIYNHWPTGWTPGEPQTYRSAVALWRAKDIHL